MVFKKTGSSLATFPATTAQLKKARFSNPLALAASARMKVPSSIDNFSFCESLARKRRGFSAVFGKRDDLR